MQLVSVETTPNPNSMKLNLSEKVSATKTYSRDDGSDAPEFIVQLLAIEGVKDVFACNDFLTLNREPRADWRPLLEKATEVFRGSAEHETVSSAQRGHGSKTDFSSTEGRNQTTVSHSDRASNSNSVLQNERAAFETEGQVHVLVQTYKGIPIQVKVVDKDGELRVSLGERFNTAAMDVQTATGADFLKERYWADHGVRYGDRADIANEVVEELQGTFTSDMLERLKIRASGGQELEATSLSVILEWLVDADWRKRLAGVQELKASVETIPLLARALKDENPQVRRLAAAALGTTGSIDAVPALCDAVLNDQHVGVRRTAGDALSDIGDPVAEPAMCEALSDSNKLVRWRAARFLFDLGTKQALPFLRTAVNDKEFEVRLEVEAAMERIREGATGIGPAWKRIVESQSS